MIYDGIYCAIAPFSFSQKVSVVKDDKIVETSKAKIPTLHNTIYNLCKQYDLHNVYLDGNADYGLKTKEKLGATQYSDFVLNIIVTGEKE